jgi:serine protease Do
MITSNRSVRTFLAALRFSLVLLTLGPAALTHRAALADGSRLPEDKLQAVFSKPQPESLEDLQAIEQQVEKVLARVMPSVVCVQIGASSGSGVIVTKDGHVLTAGHVSGSPGRDCTLVFPDGTKVKARTLGNNRSVDSGMIKIVEEGKEWPFVEMGNSSALKPGDWCLACGHPGGFRKGRTPPVRLGRILKNGSTTLAHECTIVGGDSGGPLIDMNGKVIGIESRINQSINGNFAVPVEIFRNNWEQLASTGTGSTVNTGEALFPLGYIAPAYIPNRPVTSNGFGAEKAALGPHPNILIFARDVSEPLATLATRVDEIARSKDVMLDSFVVLVAEGKELEAKVKEEMEGKLKTLVEKCQLRNTTLSAEASERVKSFRISRVSDITVLVNADGAARGVYAFKISEFKTDTSDKILADLKRILEKKKAGGK